MESGAHEQKEARPIPLLPKYPQAYPDPDSAVISAPLYFETAESWTGFAPTHSTSLPSTRSGDLPEHGTDLLFGSLDHDPNSDLSQDYPTNFSGFFTPKEAEELLQPWPFGSSGTDIPTEPITAYQVQIILLEQTKKRRLTAQQDQDNKRSAHDQYNVAQLDSPMPDAYHTATPGYFGSYQTPGRLDPASKYGKALSSQQALVAKELHALLIERLANSIFTRREMNWSGQGQHVEFQGNEKVPLEIEKAIGHSSTALIESVRCRRIRLARKCIRVHRRAKIEDLVKEVAYMQKLHHRHVVQLVGSYLQKSTFAMLLYPVATGDLTKFMDEWRPNGAWYNSSTHSSPFMHAERDLRRFFMCLARTVGYVHEQGIRHMDLKPSNILVHERRSIGEIPTRSIYLTDFGISRAFTEEDGSQTEGPTSMTKRWCSPEVAARLPRGRPSDIFSLGCVFTQMCTTLLRLSVSDFEDFRAQGGDDDSFHSNLPRVREWITRMRGGTTRNQSDRDREQEQPFQSSAFRRKTKSPAKFLDIVEDMIEEQPEQRPNADHVVERMEHLDTESLWSDAWRFASSTCCARGREEYRVAEEDIIFDAFKFGGDMADV